MIGQTARHWRLGAASTGFVLLLQLLPTYGCDVLRRRGLDSPDIPNYSLHIIDTSRMVELKRSCLQLDSPSVDIALVSDSLVFKASALDAAPVYFRLTPDFDIDMISFYHEEPRSLAQTAVESSLGTSAQDLGAMPGCKPISSVVVTKDRTVAFYSTLQSANSLNMTAIRKLDVTAHTVSAEIDLEGIGCQGDSTPFPTAVRYLFLRPDNILIVIAGSSAVPVGYD